MTLVIHQSFTI